MKSSKAIRKIRTLLASLPSEEFLALELTHDQIRRWCKFRKLGILTSECWRALHQGEGNPLSPLLAEGTISRDAYEKAWLMALFWQKWWALICVSEPALREFCVEVSVEFPFASAFELFAHIATNTINGDFAICLEPYCEISAPKMRRTCKTGLEVLENPLPDSQKERSRQDQWQKDALGFLRSAGGFDAWTRFVMVACQVFSREDRTIAAALAGVLGATAEILKFQVVLARKGQSTAWHGGKRKRGNRSGVYE